MRAWLIKIRAAFIGSPALPLIYLIPALALCILLQQQLTFFKTDGYLGLRLNAADLLLPFLGIFIIVRLTLRKDPWPQWRIPHMVLWLLALTALMTFALFKGHHVSGEWDRWAVINKYIGWYALLAYLGLGSWIGTFPPQQWSPTVRGCFIFFWVATLVFFIGYMIALDMEGNRPRIYAAYPIDGLMGNRNAFAFLSFCALALITSWHIRGCINPTWGFHAVWGLIPLFYVYNSSRSGLVILPALVLLFIFLNYKFSIRHVAIPLIIGSVLTWGFFVGINKDSTMLKLTHAQMGHAAELVLAETNHKKNLQKNPQIVTNQDPLDHLDSISNRVRISILRDALSAWQQAPLVGGGLGSFRAHQIKTHNSYTDIIDCTSLWLLVETGFIGFTLFAAFFLVVFWKVFLQARRNDPQGIYLGILLIMIIFAIMSLVHELMYTRFLWFFMGLALVLQPEERKAA